MKLQQLIDRAAAIWTGVPITVERESIGSGAYVFVDGDTRTHRLNYLGWVACGHPDCIALEKRQFLGR